MHWEKSRHVEMSRNVEFWKLLMVRRKVEKCWEMSKFWVLKISDGLSNGGVLGWVELLGSVRGWVEVLGAVWGVLGWEELFWAGSHRPLRHYLAICDVLRNVKKCWVFVEVSTGGTLSRWKFIGNSVALVFNLIFWPKIKQLLSNCPASDWTLVMFASCKN